MSYDEEPKDLFEHLLEKGLWFSVIPVSQEEWNATAFNREPDGKWYGFKSKAHPTVEEAIKWLGEILKNKEQEIGNV